MYRDPMQWEFIRRKVLQEGMSQRAVSRETGISPDYSQDGMKGMVSVD